MFNNNTNIFSENRKDGARKMLRLNKDIELFTLHQIQLNVIRPPDYLDVTKELENARKQTKALVKEKKDKKDDKKLDFLSELSKNKNTVLNQHNRLAQYFAQ